MTLAYLTDRLIKIGCEYRKTINKSRGTIAAKNGVFRHFSKAKGKLFCVSGLTIPQVRSKTMIDFDRSFRTSLSPYLHHCLSCGLWHHALVKRWHICLGKNILVSLKEYWVDPQKQEPTEKAMELLGRSVPATNFLSGGELRAIFKY